MLRILDCKYQKSLADVSDDNASQALYKIYNLGNNQLVELLRFIQVIEQALGKPAELVMKPMQPGDVVETYADVSDLQTDIGFFPSTPLKTGIAKFVD